MNITLGQASFPYFLEHIFSASFANEDFIMADRDRHEFSLSKLHYMWAGLAQTYARLSVMAPRMHLKSTVLNNAFCMWQLFKGGGAYIDGLVISYKDELAAEHVARMKRYSKANTYFRFFRDLKSRSEHVVDFICDFGLGQHWEGAVDGIGIMSAKRGLHPKFVVCDDILSDFANPLEPATLKKIDTIFNTVIQSLPAPDDPLILVGTPQSYDDTLYKLRNNPEFFWIRCPAQPDPNDPSKTAWPERFDERVLRQVRRRVRRMAFQVEYLLIPYLAVDSYLPREAVELCVDPDLHRWSLDEPFINNDSWPVYGGMDIGKEAHPTHISIAVLAPDGALVQVYEQFIDHMKYNQQAVLVNNLVEHFNVSRFYYDSTRAELDDRGLTRRAHGKKFTKQRKVQLALQLERRVFAGTEEPGLILLSNDRQVSQICAVNPQLKSVETSEGHGDSFWSVALMVQAAADGPGMQVLGDINEIFGNRAQDQFTRTNRPV
jgi:hypothetical protein